MDADRVTEILSTAGDGIPADSLQQLKDFAVAGLSDGGQTENLKLTCDSEQEAKLICAAAKRVKLKGRISFGDTQEDGTPAEGAVIEVEIWPKGAAAPKMTERELPQRRARADDDRPMRRSEEIRQLSPGDWRCTACGFVNQAKYQNEACHRCGTSKAESAGPEVFRTGGGARTGYQGSASPGRTAQYGGAGGAPLHASDLEQRLQSQHRPGGGHDQQPQQQQQQQPGQVGEWKEVMDHSSRRPYYYHTITREVTWTRPQEGVTRDASSVPVAGQATQQSMAQRPTTVPAPVHAQQPQMMQQQYSYPQQPAHAGGWSAPAGGWGQPAAAPQTMQQAPQYDQWAGQMPQQQATYGGWGQQGGKGGGGW
eukprot:TRINITY_DN2684_c0_g1_i1.p1 TRINITY_DN2684_c0_g1~~TRINITY_DN2684_c0_g1_i1.p1  ORF type:complete len:367 (+),score=97.18 TRINITY_DN2684_c0_g1_i1:149-1249(+)